MKRDGRFAEKIDDREGVAEIVARETRGEREPTPRAEQRWNSEGSEKAAGLVSTVLDWRANARETESEKEGKRGTDERGGSAPTGAGVTEQGDERGGGEERRGRTGVLGGWVLVRFSRGKRRRGVGAASGWCIIDPSVCGLGKKRSLRLGPRKRGSDTPPVYGAEKETHRADLADRY